MASNLTTQVRGIVKVVTAVANGDLSQKLVGVEAKGEIAALADTLNSMTKTLGIFAEQVTSVARTVGVEGKLGAQAEVPGVAGTWKDLTDNVNLLANNLTAQVRNIAEVTTAVANGDLSQKITVDVKGEILELKNTINTMVDQLRSFAGEVTRVAKEVGTEGKLGGQADVQGRQRHLEGPDRQRQRPRRQPHRPGAQHRQGHHRRRQRRPLAEDHRRRQGRDPRAQEHHQHHGRSAALVRRGGHARRARKSAPKASWAARPRCQGVCGTWKDLTDNVNVLAGNLTDQVRNIAKVTTAVANGDLSQKITVDVKGEILELKNTINTMVDQLRSFAARGHPRREGGRHRGQAGRPGRGARASSAPGRT